MGRTRPFDFSVVRDSLTLVEAVCQYDKQRGDFCAEVGRDVVRAERASDLERKLREELRRGLGLRWERSLVVERPGPPKFYSRPVLREGVFAQLAFGFARGEVARRSDGALLFRGWPPEDFDDELPDGLNAPDTRVVSVLPETVLVRAWSEALWRSFCALAIVLGRAHDELAVAEDLDQVRRALDLRALLAVDAKPRPQD